MGRPASGELLNAGHHWMTRLLLTALLVLAGFALLVVSIGFARHLAMRGPLTGLAPMIVVVYTYGFVFWAAWWHGGLARTAGQPFGGCETCSNSTTPRRSCVGSGRKPARSGGLSKPWPE